MGLTTTQPLAGQLRPKMATGKNELKLYPQSFNTYLLGTAMVREHGPKAVVFYPSVISLHGCMDTWSSMDTSPYFEGGELKKKCFGRYLDGQGWVLGPSKGLGGLKIGYDIIVRRLLKNRDNISDVSEYSPLQVTVGAFSHSARTARAQRAHSARTAPIITVIIRVTAPKTTHLRNHAQPIQISKIQTSDACHGSQGPKFCPL